MSEWRQERAPEPGEEPDSDEEDSDEVDYFEDVGSEDDEHDDEVRTDSIGMCVLTRGWFVAEGGTIRRLL